MVKRRIECRRRQTAIAFHVVSIYNNLSYPDEVPRAALLIFKTLPDDCACRFRLPPRGSMRRVTHTSETADCRLSTTIPELASSLVRAKSPIWESWLSNWGPKVSCSSPTMD